MNKINTPRRNFSGKDILILVLLALLLGLSFYTQKIIRLSHQNLTEISKNDSTELGKDLILSAFDISDTDKEFRGMLGISMMPFSSDLNGFRSLFLTSFIQQSTFGSKSKLESSSILDSNIWLINTDLAISKELKTIFARREGFFYGVSFGLMDRFLRLGITDYIEDYFSNGVLQKREFVQGLKDNDKYVLSSKYLYELYLQGTSIYNELQKSGYDDKLLKDTLIILASAIDFGTDESFDFSALGSNFTPRHDIIEKTISCYNLKTNEQYGSMQDKEIGFRTFYQCLSDEMENNDLEISDWIIYNIVGTNDSVKEIVKKELQKL